MKTIIVNDRWKTSTRLGKLVSTARQISPEVDYVFSVEALINKINYSTDVNDLPDLVLFDYSSSILDRGLDPTDVASMINLSVKLAASRLGKQNRELILTGVATEKSISKKSVNDLRLAGFRGQSLGPMHYGIDATMLTRDAHVNDDWHGRSHEEESSNQTNKMNIELTFRQQQICNMICQKGLTNTQIAKALGISEATVKMHVTVIFKKYAIKARSQLIAISHQLDNQRRLKSV